ncbi:hypothetical protein CANCADRAFT_54700 [Tortispora caseinolytica NRRL Y-17796]|uniref:CN hydrolase domain-containing protein n=1 Tax=Tortispora caseinolytica NRRL Y-17796 TaxID=767744 RepID=A0A1E4TD68_9ASCO|nr:hypothetical protein CANCADRAFT_54700 [Tortispora caseinolytica NRRL Y-17796]
MTSPLLQKVKVALVQFAAGADKAANLKKAETHILKAAAEGAKIVVLPECFNSPYAVTAFPEYAEPVPGGATGEFLKKIAIESKVFLVGGSIPERAADGKLYNTNMTFSPKGELLAVHRKVHLFDIDIPGKMTFHESSVLTGGDHGTVAQLDGFGNIGIGICYDVRFPELAMAAARKHNVFAMVYPGAFNLTTGPMHWNLLAQARSVDNEIYTLMCAPARDMSAGYHAYGHSLVCDPLGKIVSETDEKESIVYAELDPEVIDSARAGIPVTTQRRFDVYKDVEAYVKTSV